MRLAVLLMGLALVVLAAYTPAPEAASASAPAPADTTWSWPESPENLRVLPEDTSPERLREVMRGFTRALGVRCQYCHVGEEGEDFLTWDFASDQKGHKRITRDMMRMTWEINRETLPAIEGLHDTGEDFRVTCYTCHRGATRPATSPEAEGQGGHGGH